MIHRILQLCLTGAIVAAATPAFADSPFDGIWKGDVASAKVEAKPDRFTVKDGTYDCATCLPPYSTKADGAFHAVAGRDYWDEVAVTVVDPAAIRFQFRKAGKVIGTNEMTVSADGATLTTRTSNTNNAAGTLVETSGTRARAAPAPAGAHAISGSWAAAPASAISDASITMTIKVDGDTLTLTSGIGETVVAKFGGPAALVTGDPGKTMTKAERLASNKLRLTDMRGGKTVNVTTYTVAADGRTLMGEWRDPRDGATGSYTATKQ